MLEQLIKEWRQQAGIKSGMRGYVFSTCADQLEETLENLQQHQAEEKAQDILSSMVNRQLQMERELRDSMLPEDKDF